VVVHQSLYDKVSEMHLTQPDSEDDSYNERSRTCTKVPVCSESKHPLVTYIEQRHPQVNVTAALEVCREFSSVYKFS
jgi:hypothetical protein